MAVPKDVREALEEAGVKFDENGNIIEDENETFLGLAEDSDDDDDQDDQDNDDLEEDDEGDDDDDESDDTDDDSEEDDEDDENDDEDEDDDDDEVEDEPKSKKRKSKTKKSKAKQDADDDDDLPKLTPKQLQKQKDDGEEAMSEIRKNLKALLEKGDDFKSKKDDDDDDTQSALQELRKEAEEFRKLRFQTFANNIKDRVKQSNYGADFDDIINSTQWEEFLNKKAYGSRIGDLYRSAIQSQDADSVVFFFDDFASKYLQKPSKEKRSVNKQKDDLDDLAVPDKTKTSGSPKKRRKYDFEENDYITKLDEAERGIITREEFVKFSDAFESALSKGRVKQS